MSPKSTKPTSMKNTNKHAVPIVNVFDEDQTDTSMQPARRPVVVEIEDVPTQMESPTPPPLPQQPPERVWQAQTQTQFSAPVPEQAPVVEAPMPQPQIQMSAPEISNVAPVVLPPAQEAAPIVQPVPQNMPPAVGMSAEPTLPSFFEHDLKSSMNQNVTPMQVQPGQNSMQPPAPNMFADASAVTPQAVVGEINEAAEGEGGSNKKLIGIILMVLAVLILAIGGLFLYARNLFSPTSVPTPTPEVVATPRPTPQVTPTPAASMSATLSATESAALKKKVKVDVLNGTKVAGLATKQANLLKAVGFVTGTVGNGKAEDAGTIVYPAAYKGLVPEIKAALKDMTFTASESAKVTTIVVTLGDK